MPVPLAWLLEQDDLGLRLVCGAATDVAVEWAHAIELEDPSPWLTGGELVLTTGLRLPRSLTGQRRYAERLRSAGVAAVAFGTGVRFEQVPRGVAEACDDLGLPLLEVPLPTPFVAVTKRLADQLALEQRGVLERAVRFQRSLTHRTLHHGLQGLVNALAHELGAEVVLFDEHGAAVALSARARSLSRRLSVELRSAPAAYSSGGLRRLHSDTGALELHTLGGRAARRGWLAVAVPSEVTHGTRLLVNQAVSVATLHLDRPRELEEARAGLGAAVLGVLLQGGPATTAALSCLPHLGIGAEDDVRILSVAGDHLDGLATTIERQLTAVRVPHAVMTADGVVALVRDGDADAAVAVLVEVCAGRGGASPVGVSSVVPPSRCADALVQSRRAARAAELDDVPAQRFDALGWESVFGDDVVQARVRAMTRHVLAPLLDTAAGSTDLLTTLRTFLDCNGAWEPAARALGVHRHTMRHRVRRIEQLTGLSMTRAQDRALLLVALTTSGASPGSGGTTAARG